MKNNKGVTLSALIIMIVLLIIFTTFAIYSSVESFKLIDIQKYKTQMQAIQNGIDEFYEECENVYKKNEVILSDANFENNDGFTIGPISKNEFFELYANYILEAPSNESVIQYIKKLDIDYTNLMSDKNYKTVLDELKAECLKPENTGKNRDDVISEIMPEKIEQIDWWDNVAGKFGIITSEYVVQNKYYYLEKSDVEKLFKVKDIDIADNFIVNFQDRYVFTQTSIDVVKKGTTDNKPIYCLYQLDEEEKVIEYKVKETGGNLNVEIVEKTQYYQTIKLTINGVGDNKIKQVYFDDITEDETAFFTVEKKSDLFDEVRGIGTDTVYIKISKEDSLPLKPGDNNYKFWAHDMYDGQYFMNGELKVKLHEPPVLESDMIPFVATDSNTEGIVYPKTGSENINDWYDYSLFGEDNSKIKYATAVIASDTSNYNSIKGSKFDINPPATNDNYIERTNHIVKVWIPGKMKTLANNPTGGTNYYTNAFIGKTGIWVRAKWENNKWVPDLGYNPYGDRTTNYIEDDSLLLHYNGNDRGTTNNVWKDISGNGNDGKIVKDHNGTLANDITWNPNSWKANGTQAIVSTNDVNLGKEFTLEMTFKASNIDNKWLIDARNTSTETGYQPLYYRDKNSGIQFWNSSSGIDKNIGAGNDLANGSVNVIQLVVGNNEDGGSEKYNARLYINGVKKDSYKYNSEPTVVNGKIYIGKRFKSGGSDTFITNGTQIYSVRVYNRALTENELKINSNLDKLKFSNEVSMNATVASYSKTALTINLSSASNLKYYWKTDGQSNYTETTDNTITIPATNLKDEVKSVSIYGRTDNGKSTAIKTIQLKSRDISDNESNLIKDSGIENEDWGTQLDTWKNKWTTSGCRIDTAIAHSGRKSLLLPGDSQGESYYSYNQIMNYNKDHKYYVSFWSYLNSTATGSGLIQVFWNLNVNIDGKLGVLPDTFPINKTMEWIKSSSIFISNIDDNTTQLRLDFNNNSSSNSIRYDDICLVDLTRLKTQYSFVQDNQEWCDTFIETNNGQTVLYYYE